MLPCVCSVIDHRGRQNVVRTSVTHSAAPRRVPLLLFLPHFDVIRDLLLNRRTATWNLFVLYNKELKDTEKKRFYFKFRLFDRHENSTLTLSIVYTK